MLYLHLFSSFFHFRLYSTSRISDIAVPCFYVFTGKQKYKKSRNKYIPALQFMKRFWVIISRVSL